jgi:hypothetical protein
VGARRYANPIRALRSGMKHQRWRSEREGCWTDSGADMDLPVTTAADLFR